MKALRLPLEAQPGETYREQKQRFGEALRFVKPHMDYNYSAATLRRFARTPSQVRNIKQIGVVDWEVLRYWAEEYVPAEVMPKAWIKLLPVAA